jgi:hypothetical protein
MIVFHVALLLFLLAAPVFLVGCMVALSHGGEEAGYKVINVSYFMVLSGAGFLLAGLLGRFWKEDGKDVHR